jgi:molecular chaperone GrpE
MPIYVQGICVYRAKEACKVMPAAMTRKLEKREKKRGLAMKQHEPGQDERPEYSEQVVDADKEQLVAVPNERDQQLTEAQKQAVEYLDLLQRTQADFINYRRRMNQERAETRTNAQIELLNQLLPILDDLERAMMAIPQDLVQSHWVQGLLLTARRLLTLLNQLGIKRIGATGEQFDPRLHEAITVESNTDAPEGTIIRIVRAGYALGERVIRPAQVIVAGTSSPVDGATSSQGS